ncbi:MAG TPA: tripartite tricarboxylate transporter substrate-binding protein [Burkholderiaceae bacterium]|nr:tripartite tricarboxylate transporter substrate-binding protein [Burkholderiaceae bacterium]
MVVPFAAGGPTDVVARSLAQAMSTSLKQTIVVDNAAGAGGTIGSNKVAKAAPDGYTVLLMHIGMSTAPALYKNLPFDPLKSYEYVGLVVDTPMTLIAKPTMAAANVKDLLAYLKSNGNKVTMANAGIGSASHLCGLLFMSAIQQDLTTVPYRGTAPALNDLMGGQVDLLCDQTTNTTGQIQAQKVKAYAVTSAQRLANFKDIPTLDESGLAGFRVGVWHGVYAPKGTPKPVIDRLVQALQTGLKDPAFSKRMSELGATVYDSKDATPQALKAQLESEIAKWTPIIRKAGVYAE